MENDNRGEVIVPWNTLLKSLQSRLGGSRRLLLPVAALVGIGLLMLWVGNLVPPTTVTPQVAPKPEEGRALQRDEVSWTETQWERELAQTLSRIHGAGRVWVDLTLEGSEVNVWQEKEENEIRQVNEGGGSSRQERQNRTSRDLVFTQSGRGEVPVLQQKRRPGVLGVVIIAEGAENPGVREELWHAASVATGTGVHRVVVMAGTEPNGGYGQ